MVYTLLGIIIVVLCIKVYLLKKSAKEIAKDFENKLKEDTNTLINISSKDKDMCRLADSINKQLKILREEHLKYYQGDMELKNAITNISHDIRTPLTAIYGYLDMLEKTDDIKKQERYINVIKERTKMMKKLTDELFNYSIIMADEELKIEEVFINKVLVESIGSFYPALKQKGIKADISITDKRIIKNVDKSALERIFSNLLNNVIKYSDGDLFVRLSDDGDITFSNTAKDLSVVHVEQLFNRFYTVEVARNSTGLGLSIAKTLVERMGGKISAKLNNNKLSICIKL